MPETDVRAALAALELFEDSPAALLDRLATVARPFTLAPGEYLFHEGDPGDRISLLASGSLELLARLPGGREVEVLPLAPGELIGEMAVLAARPRRFSARASEPCLGWSFDAADIGRLSADEQPEVARRLGRLALERLREQYSRLGDHCGDDPRAGSAPRPAELDSAGPVVEVEREPGETAYLETVLFFSRFSAAEIEALFGDLRRLEAPRGAVVLGAGERRAALLFVLRGAVETSIRRGGLAARARLAGPGRIVGHLALLREDEPTPATSRARERSIVLEVPLERVAETIDRGDDTGRSFGWGVYADVVDALFEGQRPIARMAAAGAPVSSAT
jgi:CRP-like cAMP-binding protein